MENIVLSNYPPDVLLSLAIHLDLPDILNFCATDKEIDRKLCQQDRIWYHKLNQDRKSVV